MSSNHDKSGKRQGAWVIWMNEKWKPTKAKDSVVYYRRINYQAGRPVGWVHDFYRTGGVRWQGQLLSDDPVDVIDGVATAFHEGGSKWKEFHYDSGRIISVAAFHIDGTPDRWTALANLAAIFFNEKKFEQSLAVAREQMSYVEQELGTSDPRYFTASGNVTEVLIQLKRYPEALAVYARSVALKREQLGENHPEYLESLIELALLQRDCEMYDAAESTYQDVLRITKSTFGENDSRYVSALNTLAAIYVKIGRYDKAALMFSECIKINEQQNGENHPSSNGYLNNLAVVSYYAGDYDLAEPLMFKSLEMKKVVFGEKSIEYASSLVNLSSILGAMGRYEESERLLLQALAIRKATGQKQDAAHLNQLGLLYRDMRLYQKSERALLEAITLAQQVEGGASSNYGKYLYNLANVVRLRGQYERALAYGDQAIEIIKTRLGEGHDDYADAVRILALVHLNMENYSKAEDLFVKALTIKRARLPECHRDNRNIFIYLAELYERVGKVDMAQKYYSQCLNCSISEVSRLFASMSDREKEAFYQTVTDNFEKYKSFSLRNFDQAPEATATIFDLQLYTKALLLNSTAKWKQRIRTSGDTKLFSMYTAWENKQAEINKLQNSSNPAARARLDTLIAQSNSLEKELSSRSENFAKLSDKRKYSWRDVQSKLKDGEVVIEMIRVRKFGAQKYELDSSSHSTKLYPKYDFSDTVSYLALILTKNSKSPEAVILPEGNLMEHAGLGFYRNCINASMPDERSYDLFWKQISKAIGNKTKRIYFSPDGVYNSLNLNTLYNSRSKKYLLEEIDLQLVTSARDLLVERDDEFYNKLAYLFGYPDYKLESRQHQALQQGDRGQQSSYYRVSLHQEDLSELPATKTEVEKIAALLSASGWKPEVYIGKRALEEVIKDSFKPNILHIATHGFFRSEQIANRSVNPMMASGLMLAGAGRASDGTAGEDGVLTAYEAMNLNLDNTDLVVLSACKTGLGEFKTGEGVYGLQRAFKVAGARNIIMSLWKVDDDATQELLTNFYAHWLGGSTKRDAFRKAQVALKAKYPHPFHWGPFVMVGE